MVDQQAVGARQITGEFRPLETSHNCGGTRWDNHNYGKAYNYGIAHWDKSQLWKITLGQAIITVGHTRTSSTVVITEHTGTSKYYGGAY